MEQFFKFKFRLFKYGLELLMVVMLIFVNVAKHYDRMPPIGYWSLTIICGLILICTIFGAQSDYREPIDKYCEEHHVAMQELEKDFDKAEKISSYIRIGNHWLFCITDMGEAFIVGKNEIAKLEYHTESRQRGSSEYIYIYDTTGKMTKIPCSKKKSKILQKQVFGN